MSVKNKKREPRIKAGRKDGKLVDVEIFGEQIRVNNSRIGVLGLYRDITQDKQTREALSASEKRFRRMFSDSPVALRLECVFQVLFVFVNVFS